MVKSIEAAVAPVTNTSRPVPAIAAGMTWSRSRSTVSTVASSCGAVVGMICSTAARGAAGSLGKACGGNWTPGSAPIAAASAGSAAASWALVKVTAATSGPLNPGPKPSANRS